MTSVVLHWPLPMPAVHSSLPQSQHLGCAHVSFTHVYIVAVRLTTSVWHVDDSPIHDILSLLKITMSVPAPAAPAAKAASAEITTFWPRVLLWHMLRELGAAAAAGLYTGASVQLFLATVTLTVAVVFFQKKRLVGLYANLRSSSSLWHMHLHRISSVSNLQWWCVKPNSWSFL